MHAAAHTLLAAPCWIQMLDADTELAMPVRVWRKIDKMCVVMTQFSRLIIKINRGIREAVLCLQQGLGILSSTGQGSAALRAHIYTRKADLCIESFAQQLLAI